MFLERATRLKFREALQGYGVVMNSSPSGTTVPGVSAQSLPEAWGFWFCFGVGEKGGKKVTFVEHLCVPDHIWLSVWFCATVPLERHHFSSFIGKETEALRRNVIH